MPSIISSVVSCVLVWIIYSSIESGVTAAPYGAPVEACETMTPLHDGTASTNPCPFETLSSQEQMFSNETLMLTLTSKTTGPSFRGFLLMGFDTKTDRVVGTFRQDSSGLISQTLDCAGYYDSATTHISASDKTSITVEWIPPEGFDGDVLFRTTYVQDYSTFWVKQVSSIVTIIASISASTTIDPALTSTATVTLPNVYDGCGVTKGCVATPNDCIATKECSMMTTFKQVGSHVEMEIYGQISRDEYVASAISTDTEMGTDSVVECVYYRGVSTAHQSFNFPEKDNQRLQSQMTGFNLLYAAYSEGSVYCHVEHPINYMVNNVTFHLRQPYHLLMARGPTSGNKIGRHTSKGSTGSPLVFCSEQPFISYLNEASRVLKQLHGSFMVIAWLIAASIGVLMPRYMKKTWVGKQLMGKDMWFAYHRGLMVLVWTLTVAGFIIIFVDIGGWVSESVSENPHPLIGCITTALAFVQPFMALLRPLPIAPNRYIFNWAHSLVGYSAHALAITCIFLAVEMEEAELPYETYWILTSHVCCYAAAQLLLTYLARKNSIMIPLDKKSQDNVSNDEQGSLGRKIILVVYICITIGLGFTVVAFIAGA